MKRVLLIDDDPDFHEAMDIVLSQNDMDVVSAYTPDEALEKAVSSKPDVIILDVMMPTGYEGFEIARKLREDLNMRSIPILIISSVHTIKKIPYRFAPDETWIPVDIFLDKPVNAAFLIHKLNELLGTHREEPRTQL